MINTGRLLLTYLASRGFSFAWLLAFSKSFTPLVRRIVGLFRPAQGISYPECYNRRLNEFRHFALKGFFFDVFLASKEENIAFPPPSSPCNVVPMLEPPLENNKHPNFEWRGQGRGGVWILMLSEVTLFEYIL